jgi:hypothetical protein
VGAPRTTRWRKRPLIGWQGESRQSVMSVTSWFSIQYKPKFLTKLTLWNIGWSYSGAEYFPPTSRSAKQTLFSYRYVRSTGTWAVGSCKDDFVSFRVGRALGFVPLLIENPTDSSELSHSSRNIFWFLSFTRLGLFEPRRYTSPSFDPLQIIRAWPAITETDLA